MSDNQQQQVGQERKSAYAMLKSKWDQMALRHPQFPVTISLVLVVIVMSIFIGIMNPRFFLSRNLTNILVQVSGYMCLAVGMTLVMTTGGLDISVGSIAGLTSAVVGVAMSWWGVGGVGALGIGLIIGLLCGAFNGLFVVLFKVPSLIVTLGSRAAFRSLGFVFTEGELLYGFPDSFRWITQLRPLGIPFSIIVVIPFMVWGTYFLYRTKTGRHLQAIGGNREAARLAGIKVRPISFSVFVVSGLMAAVASVLAVSRLDAAQPQIGYEYEIHTIAAVVLGGTLLTGGRGLMVASFLAMLILQVLSNGMVLMGVSFFWQQVVVGIVFIMVVAIRTIRSKDQQKIGI